MNLRIDSDDLSELLAMRRFLAGQVTELQEQLTANLERERKMARDIQDLAAEIERLREALALARAPSPDITESKKRDSADIIKAIRTAYPSPNIAASKKWKSK